MSPACYGISLSRVLISFRHDKIELPISCYQKSEIGCHAIVCQSLRYYILFKERLCDLFSRVLCDLLSRLMIVGIYNRQSSDCINTDF